MLESQRQAAAGKGVDIGLSDLASSGDLDDLRLPLLGGQDAALQSDLAVLDQQLSVRVAYVHLCCVCVPLVPRPSSFIHCGCVLPNAQLIALGSKSTLYMPPDNTTDDSTEDSGSAGALHAFVSANQPAKVPFLMLAFSACPSILHRPVLLYTPPCAAPVCQTSLLCVEQHGEQLLVVALPTGAGAGASVGSDTVDASVAVPNGYVRWDGILDKQEIARGGQGSVSTCMWNGALVAVKTVDAVHAATLQREMDALKSLLHPNIVQVRGREGSCSPCATRDCEGEGKVELTYAVGVEYCCSPS